MYVKGTGAHEVRDQERQVARQKKADAIRSGTQLELADDELQADATLKANAGTVSFQGCSSSEQRELRKWHEDARDKVAAAQACTESSCKSVVDTWFGKQTSQAQLAAGATAQFNTMRNVMVTCSMHRC